MWSELVGASIVVPSDRTDGDGRNYIVIGEDVPDAIADKFTAALVFHSGHEPTFPHGFAYWVLGISNNGALEVVSYYYTFASPDEDALPLFTRQTILTFSPPDNVDAPPTLGIGNGYGAYNEGYVEVRSQPIKPVATTTATIGPGDNTVDGGAVLGPGFVNYGGGYEALRFHLLSNGMVHYSGSLRNVLGAAVGHAGVIVKNLPVWARPVATVIDRAISDAAENYGTPRVDITPEGQVVLILSTISNGALIQLNGSYYPDNISA